MPRPLPGGKSTWVGNASRSGELKVPTYARSGPLVSSDFAWSKPIMRGIAPPSATKVFKNERRELFGGVIVKTAFLVGGRLEQVLADGPKPIHLGCVLDHTA